MKLIIGSTSVKMKEGLYCLNDLHKASGGEKKNGPSYWMASPQIAELIKVVDTEYGVSVETIKGGKSQGTYVRKELVYSYAMWVNSVFNLAVIRAYDALVTGQLEDAKRVATRNTARLEAPFMTKAVQFTRQSQGKKSSHFHFSNEFNLINQIALGATAKQYKIANGIGPNEHIRDTLTVLEIACIEHLQRANTTLIEIGLDYQKRKCELSKIYTQRHARGLIDEVARLEH
tara:strand:- start:358 stop:1050 length:693 start_codon:yes stop_codon:yes gene_type:complete